MSNYLIIQRIYIMFYFVQTSIQYKYFRYFKLCTYYMYKYKNKIVLLFFYESYYITAKYIW